MGSLESLLVPGRPERQGLRPSGLPARLRSFLSAPAWARKPEPRVRYGLRFLPGLGLLGRQYLTEARPFLERADAIRGRRFAYLGRTIGFPGRIDWDPQGVSEPWRLALNGLDDLLALGVAAALAPTADARGRWYRVAATLIADWIAGSPAGRGVAWTLPCLARRIPNLVYAHTLFATELDDDRPTRRAWIESLHEQATALAAAVPGQPAEVALIHAGRALFMAGRLFDGMEARRWLESGAAVLWGQLREQVHEDGGHRSRTPTVHALVLADYLEVFAILQAANDDVPIWARKRVKGMADFLARLVHPDGQIPLFHGAALGAARPADELLATAAVVLHEPGLAPPGALPGVWPLLVLGESGLRVHAQLPRRARSAEPRALRRAGFYVLPGDPGDAMLLDGASPPPGGAGGALGYELSVGGERLVVSAGPGSEEPAAWAEYFRSTRGHNVVTVGGAEQIAGGRVPVVSEVQWAVREGLVYFSASHDGFARLAPDFRLHHRRRVFCLPGRFWIVCDEILGTGTWEAESFVHFHPAVAVSATCRDRPSFTAARSERARVRIVPAGEREIRLAHGVEQPAPQGWYAARHGERRPAQVLSLLASGRLPIVFGYALLPRHDGPAALRFDHDAFRLHATLVTGGAEYAISVVQGDVELVTRAL